VRASTTTRAALRCTVVLAGWLAAGAAAGAAAEPAGQDAQATATAEGGDGSAGDGKESSGTAGGTAIPAPEELEAQGAVIGTITIVPGDVFDTTIEGEDGWLYRTANKLHINTRTEVIRDQLLFAPGEPYRQRLLEETERNLRANVYLYDATIVPVAWDGQRVDLEVRTRDTWTLNPGVSFSRAGGKNEYAVQVQEKNLLGYGKEIEVEWESDVDRQALTFFYGDPHFLHSFTRLAVAYSDTDDGDAKYLSLERPFYALDTRWSAGTVLTDSELVDYRYELGKKVGEFKRQDEYYELRGGWSRGLVDGWARRLTYGATYRVDRFEPVPGKPLGGPLPADRKFVYPWVGFELVEDAYQERTNQDQIRRTEDVLVGLRAQGRIGYASEGLGSEADAVLLEASLQDGTDLGPGRSLFGSASVSGRYEDGEIRNGVLAAEARYYWATSQRSKFFASVSGATTEQLDQDLQLLLGGDNGLRGYPLRYQAGTSRALLTLEQRYYTKWYPFRLFHVAGAAFFDMGRTWGRDVTGAESLGLLKDVGIGLRLGSSRSAFGNVLHIDLAVPLDGEPDIDKVQLVVETKAQF
jgi:outer membrane protein assembly factor BamA